MFFGLESEWGWKLLNVHLGGIVGDSIVRNDFVISTYRLHLKID